jgi:N utilization substance protein A
MDIAAESRRAVSELFGDGDEYGGEYTLISQLPGVDLQAAAMLQEHNKDFIEDFIALSPEELEGIGLSQEQQKVLRELIEEHIEIVEEEYEEESYEEGERAEVQIQDDGGAVEAEGEDDEYECPECGAKITVDMTSCPKCGIGLSFEYEDDNM